MVKVSNWLLTYREIYLFVSPLVRVYFQPENFLGKGHKAEITQLSKPTEVKCLEGLMKVRGIYKRPRGKPEESRVVIVNQK